MTVAAPKLWRELRRNMQSTDVKAAQRGLARAGAQLGYTSTNAKNGNYGQETANDVGRFRKATGIKGDNNTIGATLWEALWPYLDATAYRLFCDQPEAVASPSPKAKKLPIKRGDNSKGVEACQRALWRALPKSTNDRNGQYGQKTAADVVAFRKRYWVNAGDNGQSIGGELWNVLTRWMDATAVALANDWQPQPEPVPPGDAMANAVASALTQVGYQEARGNNNRFGVWYGMNHVSWCAEFVTWAAEQKGSSTFVKGTRYAYCPYVVDDARAGRNGLAVVKASAVKRGALALYDWGNDGVADHIGLVVEGPGGGSSFHTVEGNTSGGNSGSQSNGDGVYQKTRYTGDVVCFATFK
jgi:peptidoglycan hydrolase-like protein with peptidoglycan-binding domain